MLHLIEADGTETEIPLDGEVRQASARSMADAAATAAAKAEAEEQARIEAAAAQAAKAQAKREAEAEAKAQAEAKAAEDAKAKARAQAKEQAEAKARELARLEAAAAAEAEAQAKAAAAARARKAAEAKARQEAEAKAKAAAEAKLKAEAEAKAKEAAKAAKAKFEAEKKAEAEAKAKVEAEKKAKAEAEAQAKAKAKAEAEAAAKAQAQAEAKTKAEADKKAKQETEAKAKADAEKKAKAAAALAARDLGKTFRRLIRETGPISLAHYMAESNARYYTSRDPLGEEGDFITAPEVSQMFGELIGLWFADLWVRMGARKRIHYVELGPGRGTLTSDALSTAARYEFAPQIHFVETSEALRAIQREKFPDAVHHDDLSTLPDDAPLLIVANEFFDALPIHQLVRSADGWHERMIGLEGNDLAFVAGTAPMDSIVPKSWKSASQGTMIETSAAASAVMGEIAQRLKNQGGAALIIDYGSFELRAGSTLQALRAHQKVDVLSHPGEADLTAHVDFELLKDVAEKNGADVMGLQMQGEWLRQMGIDVRYEALQRKNPKEVDTLKRQYDRLVQDNQMGALFKVLGICGRRWPIGVGFD
ncbi:class I SAM-dependent methyltransferase [Qipengyuania sp. ASV99]|uniref:class I SAM-dependent methyltransferase n=1 Tax=Qipengyuania sp. ASV99 TaxID=3399681 RepID=UPI003A4C7EDF